MILWGWQSAVQFFFWACPGSCLQLQVNGLRLNALRWLYVQGALASSHGLSSRLAEAFSHNHLSFPSAAREHISSTMFANVPLAKVSDMAKLKFRDWTNRLFLLVGLKGGAAQYCGAGFGLFVSPESCMCWSATMLSNFEEDGESTSEGQRTV